MIYIYHYQIEFQKRGNKFCKEIKNYCTESLEPDYENALISEVVLKFLREMNEKSYVGEYTIKRIDFIGCEKAEHHEQFAEWLTELKELRNSIGAVNLKDMKDAVRLLQELNTENDQLTSQLAEAKRLLKLAIEDFKAVNSNMLTCRYCKHYDAGIDDYGLSDDDSACEDICGWRYADEVKKLINDEKNKQRRIGKNKPCFYDKSCILCGRR